VQHRQGVLRLISELDQDLELLAELAEQNTRATARILAGATEDLDFAALGYTIHNLYSLLENYALRIAKTFENEIDASRWHRDLINRMTLEIATVRPAVWSRELARHVDELRRFRHAFRHVYDTSLDPDKLMLAQKHVPLAVSGVQGAHATLIEKLRVLAESLES